MKNLMHLSVGILVCLGFAGGIPACKDRANSPRTEAENVAPRMEEPMAPSETPGIPAERQLRESQPTETSKVQGSVNAISPASGLVTIMDDSGRELFLAAGNKIDLKDFRVGDKVVVEYTEDMFIWAISKQS